jgi:hypothetical protein
MDFTTGTTTLVENGRMLQEVVSQELVTGYKVGLAYIYSERSFSFSFFFLLLLLLENDYLVLRDSTKQ